MKRLHVHVGVDDLKRSIGFYSTLFGAEPTVTKTDYAKWMLEDPRVNFAISSGNHAAKGIEHLGIQVESGEELNEVYGRLKAADRPVLEEGATTCCYAKSEKSWIADPDGVVWEAFFTQGLCLRLHGLIGAGQILLQRRADLAHRFAGVFARLFKALGGALQRAFDVIRAHRVERLAQNLFHLEAQLFIGVQFFFLIGGFARRSLRIHKYSAS